MMRVLIAVTPNSQKFADALSLALQNVGCQAAIQVTGDLSLQALDTSPDSSTYFQNAISSIQNADLIIVEISEPSIELGYEIAYALDSGKPVGCLSSIDREIEAFLLANPAAGLSVSYYSSEEDAVAWVLNRIQHT